MQFETLQQFSFGTLSMLRVLCNRLCTTTHKHTTADAALYNGDVSPKVALAASSPYLYLMKLI